MSLLISGCSASLAQCPVLYPMPDIHVCEGGSALLAPIIEGKFAKLEWKGGKGTVQETEPGMYEYTPGETESDGVVVLELMAAAEKGCPVQNQSVQLTMDKMPQVEVTDMRKCQGQPIIMAPNIQSKYDSLLWTTSGTGVFERPNFAQSAYLPSDADVKGDGVMLSIRMYNGVCPAAEGSFRLIVDELPTAKINAVRKGDTFILSMADKQADKVKWSHSGNGKLRSDNEMSVTYEFSEKDDQVKVEARVWSIFGCEKATEIILTQK